MQIFGLEITCVKQKALTPVSGYRDGWRRILEPYAGAWQQNVEEKRESVVCYPTLYACISRIASDIGKLPFSLRQRDRSGRGAGEIPKASSTAWSSPA